MTRLYLLYIVYLFVSVRYRTLLYSYYTHVLSFILYYVCSTYIISSAFNKLFIFFVCSLSKLEYFIVYANYNNRYSIIVLVILECSLGILSLYILSVCVYYKSYNRADVREENYVAWVWVLSLIVDHIEQCYYGCGV